MADTARIFMQLTSTKAGVIPGESTVDEREGWIDLDSWSWNLNRLKADDAVPEPSPLTITKEMDRATTAMLQAMATGTQLRAKIVIDDSSLEMLELTIYLEHVTITSYDFRTETAEKGGAVSEEWTFDYRWITFEYQHDAKSGVKSVKLQRPAGASSEKPATAKEREFRKLAGELLSSPEFTVADLKEMWAEIVKETEEASNRSEGMSPKHASKVPEATGGKKTGGGI